MSDIQKTTTSSLSLKDRLNVKRNMPCILADISGSMSSNCEPGCRKIDALRSIIADLDGDPDVFAFHSRVDKVAKDYIPEPQGSTFMGRAFAHLKREGFRKVVMITDGEATDKDDALIEVEGLELKILYVGAGNKPSFLDDLAAKAGGFCSKEDLKFQKELTGKIQGLLGPARGSDTICL